MNPSVFLAGASRLWRVGVVGLALAAVGCGDDDPVAPPASQANLRALHLSPDAPAVDIYLNRQAPPAASGLAFGAGTAFLRPAAGTYAIDIAPANTAVAQAVLSVSGLNLQADRYYTAVAFDRVAAIKALALTDDLSAPASGSIRVRAVHAASAVGQVDIWNIPSSGSPTPLYENVDFGGAGPYLTLPAGAYTLGIDANNDAAPDLVFSLPALPSGSVANVFAVSDASSNVYLLAQLQNSSVVRIDPN